MVPVFADMCRYESLIDGTLGMADIALMHDALAVRDDNVAILRRAIKARRG